jgi:hypothetical protein
VVDAGAAGAVDWANAEPAKIMLEIPRASECLARRLFIIIFGFGFV